MKHILISDTHSPVCLTAAYNYVKEEFLAKTQADAIVINGDMLGVFSMRGSNIHKKHPLTPQILAMYLQQCAPNFFAKYGPNPSITKEMVVEYVQERYTWCYEELKKFASLHKTYFNLGNHESKHHFLVLNELPFLTGCNPAVIRQVDQQALHTIYEQFEQQLYALEQSHQFKYIRDNYDLINGTLIVGIPGESHSTVGPSVEAQAQEQKTKEIVAKITPLLPQVHTLILYVHTQGDYTRETGSHNTASPSLKQFMEQLPSSVTKRIYIQSHNHWSYTQFLKAHGFHFVINNAGLHGGHFNYVDFTQEHVQCFDINPNTKRVTALTLSTQHTLVKNDVELVKRFYPNFLDIYMERRMFS